MTAKSFRLVLLEPRMDTFILSWICRCNGHRSSCLPIYSIKIYHLYPSIYKHKMNCSNAHAALAFSANMSTTSYLPSATAFPGTSHPSFIALWGLWTYCHIKVLQFPFHWTWKEVSLCSFVPWPLQIWECHLQTIWFKMLFSVVWLQCPEYSSPSQVACDLSDTTTDSTFRIKFHYISEWNPIFH